MKQFYLKSLLLSIFAALSTSIMAYDCQVDGLYYNLDKRSKTAEVTYEYYYSGTEWKGPLTIPSTITYEGVRYSVTNIGDRAFYGCTGLTSVTIPNSVTSIGKWAFEGCTGLTSVTIPNSVTRINYEAFKGCTGLTNITIPNSVTYIGGGAFEGCSSLTSVTIPNSVTYIGSGAFEGCTSLARVEISDIAAWCNIEFGSKSANPLYYAHHLYYNLNGEEIKDLVIPNSVTSIGEYAFSGCTDLTSVTIPNSVTSIHYDAFNGCTGLTNITIPNSVTNIGSGAFGRLYLDRP